MKIYSLILFLLSLTSVAMAMEDEREQKGDKAPFQLYAPTTIFDGAIKKVGDSTLKVQVVVEPAVLDVLKSLDLILLERPDHPQINLAGTSSIGIRRTIPLTKEPQTFEIPTSFSYTGHIEVPESTVFDPQKGHQKPPSTLKTMEGNVPSARILIVQPSGDYSCFDFRWRVFYEISGKPKQRDQVDAALWRSYFESFPRNGKSVFIKRGPIDLGSAKDIVVTYKNL